MKVLLTVMLSSFLFFSCQSAPPEVEELTWSIEVTARPDDARPPAVYLHVGAVIREPQGFDDIRSMRIEAPGDFYWELPPEGIAYSQQGELITLQSGRMQSPGADQVFQAGAYRFFVTDIPGNRGEGEFFLPQSSRAYISEDHIPRLETADGETTAASSAGACLILVYDAQGRLLAREQADQPVETHLKGKNYSFYYILAEDTDHPVIYSLGPVFR